MKLSIVTTLYRSAGTVDEFHRRAMAAAAPLAAEVELVMVNDGSPDGSLARALAIHQTDPRVVVVDLARNFGHHKAMMTGLAYATGDLVFLIDSDLEEAPELLTGFHERLEREGCDVVYGVQETRRGGLVERATGELFFSLVRLLSDQHLPRNLLTVRLMQRDYVRVLIRHRDREFVISQLWELAGFRQVAMLVRKLSSSPTSYSLRYRIRMAVRFITTTSTKILYYILYAGLVVWFLSLLTMAYFLVRYLGSGIGVDGWTSLMISVWFFGGFITLILGVLGVYIANILSETKRRPFTVARRVHRVASVSHTDGVVAPIIAARGKN